MSLGRFGRRVRAFIAKPFIVVQTKPVIIRDENLCVDPIFLVGLHRSGTSLVRRMFNSHPSIACPPESFFLKWYCDIYKDPTSYSGFRGFGQGVEDMRRHLARQASELHEAYRISQGKRRWADKTPQYTECLDELSELFGRQAQFVLIFRNPLDVAYSIYERGWRFVEGEGDLLALTIKYVRDRLENMRRFLAENPDVATALWYEELVVDPETHLGQVMSFLGEPYDNAMLRFNEKSHNFGTEDPIVRGTRSLRASGGYWRNLPVDERSRLEEGLGPVARELGYAL